MLGMIADAWGIGVELARAQALHSFTEAGESPDRLRRDHSVMGVWERNITDESVTYTAV